MNNNLGDLFMNDLRGQHFGRLTVIDRAGTNKLNRDILWKCKCVCGNTTIVDAHQLRSGGTRSCGCLRREKSREKILKDPKFLKNMGKFSNLQNSDHRMKNSLTLGKKNKSGIVGVSFDKHQQVWLARLMINKKYVLAKSFKNFDEAVQARKEAEKRYSLH